MTNSLCDFALSKTDRGGDASPVGPARLAQGPSANRAGSSNGFSLKSPISIFYAYKLWHKKRIYI